MTNHLARPVVAGAVLQACAVKTAAHATPPTPRQQETEITATPLATIFLRTAYLRSASKLVLATILKYLATPLQQTSVATGRFSTSYFWGSCNTLFGGTQP